MKFLPVTLSLTLIHSLSSVVAAPSDVEARPGHGGSPGLTQQQVRLVRDKMLAISNHSWELGTATQALLELDDPEVSIFGKRPFPLPYRLFPSNPVVEIAKKTIDNKPAGIKALMRDGSAGDPCSLGMSVIIASNTFPLDSRYTVGASQQFDHIVNEVPRVPNGAISHREAPEQAQLWNDFISMGPPFIAYYGATNNNKTALREAANQVRLYREVMRDPATNLWKHILLGSWSEPSLWGTGIGWSAHGTVRVLHTLMRTRFAKELSQDIWDLIDIADELVTAAYAFQKPNGALMNHPTRADADTFEESAWTAIIAATAYRLAVLTGETTHLQKAALSLQWIKGNIQPDGLVLPVVDVFEWKIPGTFSPEAQAFVLMLHSAHRDYLQWTRSGSRPSTAFLGRRPPPAPTSSTISSSTIVTSSTAPTSSSSSASPSSSSSPVEPTSTASASTTSPPTDSSVVATATSSGVLTPEVTTLY